VLVAIFHFDAIAAERRFPCQSDIALIVALGIVAGAVCVLPTLVGSGRALPKSGTPIIASVPLRPRPIVPEVPVASLIHTMLSPYPPPRDVHWPGPRRTTISRRDGELWRGPS
jgi:hypothetical protein